MPKALNPRRITGVLVALRLREHARELWRNGNRPAPEIKELRRHECVNTARIPLAVALIVACSGANLSLARPVEMPNVVTAPSDGCLF
jgi:hypothetical protein